MKVSYFPGCTLRTTAKKLDYYARACAEKLGIELVEIKDWQCCGGVFVTAKDDVASKLPSVRALRAAKEQNEILVTVCSACHNVIKQTSNAMQTDSEFADKVNLYMAQDSDAAEHEPYRGDAQVMHFFELLRDVVGFDKIKENVVKPLTGRKIAPYYGCLLLRPGKVLAFDDIENPSVMENFIRALGAEPVIYPFRNECCGGYVSLEDPESAAKKSAAVTCSALSHGAECAVTACPLCKYNLEKNTDGMPVVYFTELLAEALGIKEDNDVR